MSNFQALATVTATLSQIIQDAIQVDVPGASISTVRPDLAGVNSSESKVNIFLYQVTTNSAMRNVDLPTRRTDGSITQRPKVALDVHYLLTFYGDETRLVPQLLLGSVVRTLHGEPQLTRPKITATVNALSFLQGSNLAEDVELVKFTPLPLSIEELSKLWSFLIQAPYALSIIYMGTVVIIESDEIPRQALPVKTPRVFAIPFSQPVIDQILSQRGNGPKLPDQPIVTGDTLFLVGKQLQSPDPARTTQVRIAGVTVPSQPIDKTQLSVAIPATLPAGVQRVQIVQSMDLGLLQPVPVADGRQHGAFESNIVPFVLRPTLKHFDKVNVQAEGNNLFSATITMQATPTIGSKQRVALLLNQTPTSAPPGGVASAAYSFIAEQATHTTDTDTLAFSIKNVLRATYFVRIQVDGAESIISDTDPQLSIP